MSVRVPIKDLAGRLEEYGAAAFVVTVGADEFPKVVHVPVTLDGEIVRCEPGEGTTVNISEGTAVTLVFPSPTAGGYSMIVDGKAIPELDRRDSVRIEFVNGVLHRPPRAVSDSDIHC